MRAIFGLVLIVGLGLAGFAVYMVQGYFEEQEARLSQTTPTVTVIAVKETVAFGEPILSDNLQFIEYAEEHLPEGIFLYYPGETNAAGQALIATADRTELVPENAAGPRYALRQIEANEPLLEVKLSEPGQETTVSNSLTQGMRAFDLPVNLMTGSSAFLRPGDRVDVFWSGSVESGLGREEMTRLILSGVRIVAVDQSTDRARTSTTPPRSVTLEVSPQQVGNLEYARQNGDLSLAQLGDYDETTAAAVEVDRCSLLGICAPVVVEPEIVEVEEERVCTIRQRLGGELREVEIPCTN